MRKILLILFVWVSCGSWTSLVALGVASDAKKAARAAHGEIQNLKNQMLGNRTPETFCTLHDYDSYDDKSKSCVKIGKNEKISKSKARYLDLEICKRAGYEEYHHANVFDYGDCSTTTRINSMLGYQEFILNEQKCECK